MLPPDSVIHLLMELTVAPCGSQSMNVCSEVVMSGTRSSTMVYIGGELA